MSLSAVAPMEILRRLLALACLLVGGYLFFWPGTPLLVVSLADLRQDFEHRITTTKEDLADPQAFADFVAYRTEGRTRPVQGEQWRELADRLAAPDPDPSTDLAARKLDSGANPRYLFRPSEPPFDAAAPYRDFQYLRLDQDTLLAVSLQPPQEILGLPGNYAHPLRTTGLILAAAGLLAYALLPRRRPGPGELRYGRFASVIGADLLGLVFAVGFAILPLLVVWENNPGGSVFSDWLLLAVPLWFMAGLGVVLLGVGARYAGLAWRIDPDGLTRVTGRTETLFPWADIEKAEPYRTRIGRILGTLLMTLGRSPGTVGQGMLVASNEEYGARVRMKDGRTVKVMANHLAGFNAILKALVNNNVPGADRPKTFFAEL